MKILLILIAAAATLAVIQPAAATTAKGQLFHNGKVVGTVVPPDHIAAGSGLDPLYMVTNGASGQLGIAGVGPGDGPFHGGAWAVYLVTFTNGVTPYLLTSDEAVTAALQAGDVTVVRAPDLDNRCPVYLRRDGYETLEAADGDRARELIEKGEPSLVVLDVMLPGTDGLTLCRTSAGSARSSRTTRRIPRRSRRSGASALPAVRSLRIRLGPSELAELGASFNEMAGRLEDLFDARRELIVWASHDLRTPLTSLQAMLEALEDGLGEPERYLVSMREQVELLGPCAV